MTGLVEGADEPFGLAVPARGAGQDPDVSVWSWVSVARNARLRV